MKKAAPTYTRRRPVFFREWRKHRKLTQEQLAEMVGRSTSWVSMIETGEILYNEEALDILADALNCSPADLLQRKPTQDEPILSIWRKLEPAQQRQAAAVIEAISKTP